MNPETVLCWNLTHIDLCTHMCVCIYVTIHTARSLSVTPPDFSFQIFPLAKFSVYWSRCAATPTDPHFPLNLELFRARTRPPVRRYINMRLQTVSRPWLISTSKKGGKKNKKRRETAHVSCASLFIFNVSLPFERGWCSRSLHVSARLPQRNETVRFGQVRVYLTKQNVNVCALRRWYLRRTPWPG